MSDQPTAICLTEISIICINFMFSKTYILIVIANINKILTCHLSTVIYSYRTPKVADSCHLKLFQDPCLTNNINLFQKYKKSKWPSFKTSVFSLSWFIFLKAIY